MNLFEDIKWNRIRKNDKQYINSTDKSIVLITDTNLNDFYITVYVIDQSEVVIIYRNRSTEHISEKRVNYTNPKEIKTDIDNTSNSLLKLHLIEVLFYTWGIESINDFSHLKFDSITVAFALYSKLISLRFFNHIFSLEDPIFNGEKEITTEMLYGESIDCDTVGSAIPEYIAYNLYCSNPQPWVVIGTDNESRSFQNTYAVKDACTVSSISDVLNVNMNSYPDIPIYQFSMFDIQSKIESLLDHVSQLDTEVIVSAFSPYTVNKSQIPKNVTFINSSSGLNSDYSYRISTEERITEDECQIKFFREFQNDMSQECVVNDTSYSFQYSSQLLSILNTVDPHIHHKSLEGFIQGVFH